MLQTLIASDSKTVTNATHVRGQVGSRALIVPHLSTPREIRDQAPCGNKIPRGVEPGDEANKYQVKISVPRGIDCLGGSHRTKPLFWLENRKIIHDSHILAIR